MWEIEFSHPYETVLHRIMCWTWIPTNITSLCYFTPILSQALSLYSVSSGERPRRQWALPMTNVTKHIHYAPISGFLFERVIIPTFTVTHTTTGVFLYTHWRHSHSRSETKYSECLLTEILSFTCRSHKFLITFFIAHFKPMILFINHIALTYYSISSECSRHILSSYLSISCWYSWAISSLSAIS